jgi:endonuclease G
VTETARRAPVAAVPTIPSPAAAARRQLVDPNGLFQYGFPGPINDLRPAPSLTSSYDRERRNPAWVAEHITPESLATSNGDRKHSVFVEDITIPEMFRAKLKDYFRSGYDIRAEQHVSASRRRLQPRLLGAF